jgi:hypothetical protein
MNLGLQIVTLTIDCGALAVIIGLWRGFSGPDVEEATFFARVGMIILLLLNVFLLVGVVS